MTRPEPSPSHPSAPPAGAGTDSGAATRSAPGSPVAGSAATGVADTDGAYAVTWWRAEPGRLAQDQQELAACFPDLSWCEPAAAVRGAGGWRGQLPLWPFTRPSPPGLESLEGGLHLELVYPQAYPLVAPRIYPLHPEPALMARTDHRWHLNGDGSLCLLQDTLGWRIEDSVTDLLLKAAAWRIEYALMHAELLEAMTESGIVSDTALDTMISYLPTREAPAPAPTPVSAPSPDALPEPGDGDGMDDGAGQARPPAGGATESA